MTAAPTESDRQSPFFVPAFVDALGGLVQRHRKFWLWLGRLESSMLAEKLRAVAIQKPLYVCGLARSGSTVLHEVVASHSGVATHRIKDYPMLFTPYWWRSAIANLRPQTPRQRVHQDGVMVNTESPDALEEMLWMAFFPRCHDAAVCSVLGAGDSNAAFERFYSLHVRKLLLVEGASRYAAKANYHIARMAYLLRLFPDARFIIPVRRPEAHVASLMRQQCWFAQGQRKHPRALNFMRRTGHFEFGLDRRPMNLGDAERVQRITAEWASGDEVHGLAMYWDMVYGYLARLLASDRAVRDAVLVVRFEDLCAMPEQTLCNLLKHCALPDAESIVNRCTPTIRAPTYYKSDFSPQDLAVIRAETEVTAGLWGY